ACTAAVRCWRLAVTGNPFLQPSPSWAPLKSPDSSTTPSISSPLTHEQICTLLHTHTHTHTETYTHTQTYTHTHIHAQTNAHIHTQTNTHIHTHTLLKFLVLFSE